MLCLSWSFVTIYTCKSKYSLLVLYIFASVLSVRVLSAHTPPVAKLAIHHLPVLRCSLPMKYCRKQLFNNSLCLCCIPKSLVILVHCFKVQFLFQDPTHFSISLWNLHIFNVHIGPAYTVGSRLISEKLYEISCQGELKSTKLGLCKVTYNLCILLVKCPIPSAHSSFQKGS